jgi:hypothetical protein
VAAALKLPINHPDGFARSPSRSAAGAAAERELLDRLFRSPQEKVYSYRPGPKSGVVGRSQCFTAILLSGVGWRASGIGRRREREGASESKSIGDCPASEPSVSFGRPVLLERTIVIQPCGEIELTKQWINFDQTAVARPAHQVRLSMPGRPGALITSRTRVANESVGRS